MKREQIWFWLVMALPFCAILSLGAMAYAALREQAAEESRRRLEEAVARVCRRAPVAFGEVVQGIPDREVFRPGTVRAARLAPMVVPDSSAGLEALALAAREAMKAEGSATLRLPEGGHEAEKSILLEGMLNAETDELPFWFLRLMRAAVDDGDTEGARRYHARAASWTRDVRLPDGFSWKTAMWAEALLAELKASGEPTSRHIFGGATDLPVPDFESSPACPVRYRPLLRLPAFAAVLELWKSVPAQPRIGWIRAGNLRLVCFQRFGRFGFALGDPARQAFGEALQGAAGERVRVTLIEGEGPEGFALPGLTGVRVRIDPMGAAAVGLPFGRLYVGMAVALGMAGLAGLALLGVRRRQQEQVQGEKEWLFRQAAHDLKTPLATVRALAETLHLGRVTQPGQAEAYLEKIMRECDYSAELIDSVLLLARVRAGVVEMRPERFDFCLALRTLIERFQPRLAGWQIEWEIPDRAELSADPHMFERVMQNLIENVVQHAAGGKNLLIIVKPTGLGGWEVGIGDRGPGFDMPGPPGAPPPEPRSGTHTRSRSGLGLSLISVILERHRSEFRVEARAGGGALVITIWPSGQSGAQS